MINSLVRLFDNCLMLQAIKMFSRVFRSDKEDICHSGYLDFTDEWGENSHAPLPSVFIHIHLCLVSLCSDQVLSLSSR